MRLLVLTQEVDRQSATLGFFHEWVQALAPHVSTLSVVCLKEGVHALPQSVRVYSLGKEKKQSRIAYIRAFVTHMWRLHGSYDAVFVHMNEEYVLLGGWWWKLWGIPVFLWRNHYAGSWKTRLAGRCATKVFYTSRASFTASFKRAVQMPVGVDLSRFAQQSETRNPRSILFLGRMSPSKRPGVLLDALALLRERGVEYTASLHGPHTDVDTPYVEEVRKKARALGNNVHVGDPIPYSELGSTYAKHEIYVNLSDPGMYDKTLFEAAVSGCVVLSASPDFNELHGLEGLLVEPAAQPVSEALEALLTAPEGSKEAMRARLRACAEGQSLAILAQKLVAEIRTD